MEPRQAGYKGWDTRRAQAPSPERWPRLAPPPPVHVVSENADPKATVNPAFELGYWRFGLRTAQAWRKRLVLPPHPHQDSPYVLSNGGLLYAVAMMAAGLGRHPALPKRPWLPQRQWPVGRALGGPESGDTTQGSREEFARRAYYLGAGG